MKIDGFDLPYVTDSMAVGAHMDRRGRHGHGRRPALDVLDMDTVHAQQ